MGFPDTAIAGTRMAEDPRYGEANETSQLAKNSKKPCEPELLLFAGMNDHVYAAGLLEPLRIGESTPKKIWEAVQMLFASMNEIQELVAARWGS